MKTVGNAILQMYKKKNEFSHIRRLLEINFTKHPPGDSAFGHMASDHPWIPFMRILEVPTNEALTLPEK
jgi:hypothetical protein